MDFVCLPMPDLVRTAVVSVHGLNSFPIKTNAQTPIACPIHTDCEQTFSLHAQISTDLNGAGQNALNGGVWSSAPAAVLHRLPCCTVLLGKEDQAALGDLLRQSRRLCITTGINREPVLWGLLEILSQV